MIPACTIKSTSTTAVVVCLRVPNRTVTPSNLSSLTAITHPDRHVRVPARDLPPLLVGLQRRIRLDTLVTGERASWGVSTSVRDLGRIHRTAGNDGQRQVSIRCH